jgi:UPF0755 protein
MKKLSLLLVAGLMVFLVVGYRFYANAVTYSRNPEGSARVVFDVKQGESAVSVAEHLYDEGLIESPFIFRLYLKQKGLAGQIKAGRIILQENQDLPAIVEALIEGKSTEVSVTLLEGWTVRQIAEYLEGEGLTTADDFMNCIKTCSFEGIFLPEGYLEGYLYPDTYFVAPSAYSDQSFIQRLIDTFHSKIKSAPGVHLERSNVSLEQVVIMASIVEREERRASERPTVAGILWNRFNAGMGLGADATVLYALGRTKGGLSYDDLQIDSPYNTRKYRGLPPTPICNPSISSIEAAYSPEDTDYWYYLHDNDGQVHYATTNDEHNANKAKYL